MSKPIALALAVIAITIALGTWMALTRTPRSTPSQTARATAADAGSSPTGCDIDYVDYEASPGSSLVLVAMPVHRLTSDASYTLLQERAGSLQAEVLRELLRRRGAIASDAIRLTADAAGRVRARGLAPGRWQLAILEPERYADCFETVVAPGRVQRVERRWPKPVSPVKVRCRVRDAQTQSRLAGASVRVLGPLTEWSELVTGTLPSLIAARTDDAGECLLEVTRTLDRALYIVVEHADYLGCLLSLPPHNELSMTFVVALDVNEVATLECHLVAKAMAATLRGRVIDPTGAPIAAEVGSAVARTRDLTDIATSGGTTPRARTDAAGRFELGLLVPGPVRLEVTAKGHAKHETMLALAPGEIRTLPPIVLAPESPPEAHARLDVRIVDSEGRPLRANLALRSDAASPASRQLSGVDGRTVFDVLLPGELRLEVQRDDYSAEEAVKVAAGTLTRHEHVIPSGSRFLAGVVVSGGEPRAGVRVELSLTSAKEEQRSHCFRTRTSRDGRFRMAGLPDARFRLFLTIDDPFAETCIESVDLDREDLQLEAPQPPGLTVIGQVRDSSGKALAGWVVDVDGHPVTTGPDGGYRIVVPMTQSHVRVEVQHSTDLGYAGGRSTHIQVGEAEPDLTLRHDFVLFREEELATVVGSILDSAGRPLPGARCHVWRASAPPPAATTLGWGQSDGLGKLALAWLEPGEVELAIEAPDHIPWRRRLSLAKGSRETVSARLEAIRSADVRLQVRRADGRCAGGAPVRARSTHPPRWMDTAVGLDNVLELGTWPLVPTSIVIGPGDGIPGHRFMLDSATLLAPAALLTLLGGDRVVTGIVVDPAGKPQPGLPVHLRSRDGVGSIEEHTVTDIQGRFRFAHLPSGSFALDVADLKRTLRMVRPEDGDLEIVVVPAPGRRRVPRDR